MSKQYRQLQIKSATSGILTLNVKYNLSAGYCGVLEWLNSAISKTSVSKNYPMRSRFTYRIELYGLLSISTLFDFKTSKSLIGCCILRHSATGTSSRMFQVLKKIVLNDS